MFFSTRSHTRADDEGVTWLHAACSDEEWEHGGSDHRSVPAFGCIGDQGEVLAMAGYKVWGREIAHISIVSPFPETSSDAEFSMST